MLPLFKKVLFIPRDEDMHPSASANDRDAEVSPTTQRVSNSPNTTNDRIPENPPFTAILANLSNEINDQDIYEFFN